MSPKKAAWRQKRAGEPPRGWARQGEIDEYRGMCLGRIAALVEVHEPFVLVSQIQRSGGTLMTRFFDGHPECHVHHGDMEIGYPRKSNWPRIPLDADRDRWFEILYEEKSHKGLRELLAGTQASEFSNHPRGFLPRLQKVIFDHCVEKWEAVSARDVLDAYLTSYFNAWLDNRNLYTGPKRAVVGFAPKMNMDLEGLEQFFATYPDGTLISIVRDPRSWYASAQHHKPYFAEVDNAIERWRRSVESSLEAAERFGDRVFLLTFEDLVLETEQTMSRIAGRIGITMSPVLLTPTFNGDPKVANSSHQARDVGVLEDRTRLYLDILDAGTIARIEHLGGELYERAAAVSSVAG